MEILLIGIIVVAPIISFLGWLVWVALAATAIRGAVGAAAASQQDMERLLQEISMLLASAQPPGGPGTASLSPQQQQALTAKIMQAQTQMAHLDALSRQRYDLRVSELQGMAASAGLDWRP